MLRKDFSVYLIIIFVLTFATWFVLGFLSIGYEEGTDKSNFGKTCYKIASVINFSGQFWQKLFPSFLSIVLSVLTTSVLIAGLVLLVKKIIEK